MRNAITRINETVAVALTKGFGTMWVCYAFIVYGALPTISLLRPYQESFLYWSNWVQLWSLPLIMVGTNILGRNAEARARLDHDKLAKSYEEQQRVYKQLMVMLKRQEEMMADLVRQDSVLAEQTEILKREENVLLHREGDGAP